MSDEQRRQAARAEHKKWVAHTFATALADTRPESRLSEGWHGYGCGEAVVPRRQTCFFAAATAARLEGQLTQVQSQPTRVWADVWRPTVHGPFKRYRLYQLTSSAANCDHCWRRIGVRHSFIRYGNHGAFLCCLHCVRWREVPADEQDNYTLERLTTEQYVELARTKPSSNGSLWMPAGRCVTDKDAGHGVVVWVDPEAPESRVAIFFTSSADLALLTAINPIQGEACTHPRNPNESGYRELELDEEWQRLNAPYDGLDADELQLEFERMATSDS